MSIRRFCFVAVFVVAVVVGQDDIDDNRNNTFVVSEGADNLFNDTDADAGGNLFNDTDAEAGGNLFNDTDADAGGNLFNDTDADGDDFDNDVGGEGTRLTGAEKTVKKGGLFATLISKSETESLIHKWLCWSQMKLTSLCQI